MKSPKIGAVLLSLVLAPTLPGAEEARPVDAASFALETANTALVFSRAADGRVWEILHYGGRLGGAADAEALSSARTVVAHHAQSRAATYAARGDAGLLQINRNGGLAVAHADGTLSTRLVCERAETVPDADGATHLVFRLRDEAEALAVIQHFRALAACDVIETWVEIRNGEAGPVRLEKMDSFAVDCPVLARSYHVHHLSGQWGAEAQVVETEVKRGETVGFGSRSGIRDAFESNAGVMVSVGERATERTGRVFGGVLCWSGLWRISVRHEITDALALRAGVDNCCGAYVLDAGKSIVLPKFAFTWSSRGKGQVSRNLHRWARDWQMPAGRRERPVLLNSWEGSYFSFTEKTLTDMMDGVREMGGEMFVLDDGWFGTGRYARDDVRRDTAGLGDWVVNPGKLPHGLDGLASEAKARGLRFGLWVEPEMVNTNSWLYARHPDWTIRERTRPLHVGRGGSQTVLDLVNPAVRDNLFGQLDRLYAGIPDLAYVKWDANADLMDLGSPSLDAAHQANFAFDYTQGLYDLLARLRAKHPHVDIQACASGGGRADYGFLRYADEFWGSDDSDARERVFIQWGEGHFFPAQAIAAHVTAVPNHGTRRRTPLKFRFDVAMSGRLGFELHPKDLTDGERAFAKAGVATYKRIRPVVQQGDLYRLVAPYGNSHAALMYADGARRRAVVFVFGFVRTIWRDFAPMLPLDGLDPGRRYRIAEINREEGAKAHSRADGRTVSGAALMELGLPIELGFDYDSAVFELTAGE